MGTLRKLWERMAGNKKTSGAAAGTIAVAIGSIYGLDLPADVVNGIALGVAMLIGLFAKD